MRLLRWVLFCSLWITSALAGVPCAVPFNLQNGTTADASQVMANYNALITCLASAAAAGNNSDITALNSLSTPLTPSQGGSSTYIGANSTGTANAQVVATTTPSNFTLGVGRTVYFIPGGTLSNTGATTLNVNSTGAVPVFRRDQFGISALVGGELIAGIMVAVTYDGSEWVITSIGPVVVGEIKTYTGTVAPPGWAFADGTCATRVGPFAALFGLIGTQFDPGAVCDVAHFALPDGRGRTFVGQDNFGVGAANRITNAVSGCVGTTLGLGCGLQARAIAQTNIPAYDLTITDTGHVHNLDPGNVASLNIVVPTGGGSFAGAGTATSVSLQVHNATTGIVVHSNGGGTAFPVLQPLQLITFIIKL